jgi:hypothetical protein
MRAAHMRVIPGAFISSSRFAVLISIRASGAGTLCPTDGCREAWKVNPQASSERPAIGKQLTAIASSANKTRLFTTSLSAPAKGP